MKKIVMNALQYKQNSSGIGVLIRELFAPLTDLTKRTCQIILPKDTPAFPAHDKFEELKIPFEHGNHFQRIFFQTFRMGKQYCMDSILLTTDSKIPFSLPKNCTLIPIITDLAVFRMPEVYQNSRVLWWRFQYQYLRRKAWHWVAISEFTKRELVEILKIQPDKIDVVPCAASKQYAPVKEADKLLQIKQKYQLPEQYLLFVGNQNPRKNLQRLLLAYDQAIYTGRFPHHLVIAGEQGWKFDREACLKPLQNKNKIHFIGFVPDEDMPALYANAVLFLFPTLYEGFGIPVLEAQLCGTPVLTSNCTSLPEVGGEAAIYVDPYQVENITQGIITALQNPTSLRELSQKGFENAKKYSWEKSAQLLNEIIERVVKT